MWALHKKYDKPSGNNVSRPMFMPCCGEYFSGLVASHKADMANHVRLLGINTHWRFAIGGDK